MKALILNSGMGSRMGVLTSEHPKCMTQISARETILSRQLRQLADHGVTEVVMTTGLFSTVLEEYCDSLLLPLRVTFVHNPRFRETNYIQSIWYARELLDDDLLLLHGDLVLEDEVFDMVLAREGSCMTVSSTLPLPQKDFKAVVKDGRIVKVGIEFFEDALAAQPFYRLAREDARAWLAAIDRFIGEGQVKCYAENALNTIADTACRILPLDVKDLLCAEIDDANDLAAVSARLRALEERTVYMCFSTDLIHSGHIAIIRRAARLGRLIVGVMTDEAVIGYKRYPLVPFSERSAMLANIVGVWKVVPQDTLSYRANLEKYRPDIVVHGDDWCTGFQRPVRDEVLRVLQSYGGRLVEYPYGRDDRYEELERRAHAELATPDARRRRLRRAIELKGTVTAIEAHSGLTGLIAEKTVVYEGGAARQFDAMWISSLCDSTAKGKPDIELVDMTSRFRTIDDIMEVTTKPIIFDGDTGGLTEHFVYTVRTLERMGVSMVIIEDKAGLKKNSLFGNEVPQTQDSIEHFS